MKDWLARRESKLTNMVEPIKLVKLAHGTYEVKEDSTEPSGKKCGCCCDGHCKLSKNCHKGSSHLMHVSLDKLMSIEEEDYEFPAIFENESFVDGSANTMAVKDVAFDAKDDPLYSMLMALETDFNLEH